MEKKREKTPTDLSQTTNAEHAKKKDTGIYYLISGQTSVIRNREVGGSIGTGEEVHQRVHLPAQEVEEGEIETGGKGGETELLLVRAEGRPGVQVEVIGETEEGTPPIIQKEL